jgi:NAD+ kinase
VPLLGVNLGHVGFLAEAEREDLDATVERIVSRDYTVEERMTLEVHAFEDGHEMFSSWALNEVTVEKASRERMLELTVAIDGRPLSTWGCDGIVMATPTGSTAYAFSARGPIVAPTHRAMQLTPVSPHMLFDRTLVLDDHTVIDLVVAGDRHGTVSVDGRTVADLLPGARVRCTASSHAARLVLTAPRDFHRILKAKFGLSDR